jgi:GTPase
VARPIQAASAGPSSSKKPVVAIVGRPNVGKSTVFNRLVGARRAIVEDIPGTTRDRLYGEGEYKDQSFTVVDTGGLEPDASEGYSALIKEQVEVALAEADILLFIVDVTTGVTRTDSEIAELLRRSERPVILLANKVDNETRSEAVVEFFELGVGEPMPISAYHGLGLREVLERVSDLLPAEPPTEDAVDELRLAVVGRPNVGKSALVNAILGQDRVIVSEEAGTTRDAVDTPFL